MKEKDYEVYQKLLIEAKELNVLELFKKAYDIGFSVGYDIAVKRFEEEY